MKITPIVPGDRPLMVIRYYYRYRKVLVVITNKEAGSTDLGGTYLYLFPGTYYDVSIGPVVQHYILGRYSNACNSIY